MGLHEPLLLTSLELYVSAKLQTEVRRLQEVLEEKRLHRLESSEHLIKDAKTRLESFRNSVSIFSISPCL